MAVAVGLGGDPLGKKGLGLLVSGSVVSASGTTGEVVTTEVDVTGTSFSFLPQTSDVIATGPYVVLLLFLSFTVAKNCCVDAMASSLLASLVLWILLGVYLTLLSGFTFKIVSGVLSIEVSKGASHGLSSRTWCFPSPASSVFTAVGKSPRDPSGNTFKDGSSLISSGLGEAGVKCPLRVEYCRGTSSPGSPLIHSLHLNVCALSNADRLGVIPEVGSHAENELGCCNRWYKILYFDSYFSRYGL